MTHSSYDSVTVMYYCVFNTNPNWKCIDVVPVWCDCQYSRHSLLILIIQSCSVFMYNLVMKSFPVVMIQEMIYIRNVIQLLVKLFRNFIPLGQYLIIDVIQLLL